MIKSSNTSIILLSEWLVSMVSVSYDKLTAPAAGNVILAVDFAF